MPPDNAGEPHLRAAFSPLPPACSALFCSASPRPATPQPAGAMGTIDVADRGGARPGQARPSQAKPSRGRAQIGQRQGLGKKANDSRQQRTTSHNYPGPRRTWQDPGIVCWGVKLGPRQQNRALRAGIPSGLADGDPDNPASPLAPAPDIAQPGTNVI